MAVPEYLYRSGHPLDRKIRLAGHPGRGIHRNTGSRKFYLKFTTKGGISRKTFS
jgi:hypothetical protein